MKRNKFINSLIQIGTILLAALVVVGITYTTGQLAAASGGEQGQHQHGDGHGNHGGHDDHGGHHDHDDHDHGPSGFRTIADFAETLVPITLIVGGFAIVQSFWGGSKRKSKVPAENEDRE